MSAYSVLVRENGKLLGRITPDGTTTNRKIFASIFTKEQAENLAADINSGENNLVEGLSAKAIKF